jgi:hypothetical protein
VLNGYQLYGVDVEDLCQRVARNYCRRTNARLPVADMDDLVCYLIETAWELSERFNPTTTTSRFANYAYSILSLRCVDWTRQHTYAGRTRWQFKGRTYEREAVVPISLDAATTVNGDGYRLVDTVADHRGDVEGDRVAALEWFDLAGCREQDRDYDRLRQEADRRGQGRARSQAAERRRPPDSRS